MKLTYFKFRNFGDNLNGWLFPRLAPESFFDDDPQELFYGIGTILGLVEPDVEARRVVVFSSGYSPHYNNIPNPALFSYLCVRGPKTAEALGLPRERSIADGAYLLRFAYSPSRETIHDFSFMPHVGTTLDNTIPWEAICAKAGVHYIDPVKTTEEVLADIAGSRVVIAEAMHAAIVADALRVPWIPCCLSVGINRFKWRDFTESVGLEYRPVQLPLVYSREVLRQRVSKKMGLLGWGPLCDSMTMVASAYQRAFRLSRLHDSIASLKNRETFLSDERTWDTVSSRLMEQLDRFCRRSGCA